MKRLQPYIPVMTIFCLALLIRVVYNLTVGRSYVPLYDSQAYEKIALHMLQEHCFCLVPYQPTAGRAPLWPTVIASIYALLGPKNFFVRLFLCFIGSGTCAFVYLLTKDIFNKRIALLAGILAAIYPGLFIYDGWLYSESLYTFLLLAFVYTLYLIQRTGRQPWMIGLIGRSQGPPLLYLMAYCWPIVSGVLLGLLSLTRPNGLIILGLVFLWVVILVQAKVLSWSTATKSAIIIALISLAMILPWTARNYIVSNHQFIPVATGDGIVLEGAYNDMVLDQKSPYYGIWVRPGLSSPILARKYGGCAATCEVQRDTAYKNQAGQWVQSHLNEMPQLLGLHLLKMWTPATGEGDLPMNQFPDRLTSRIVVGMITFMSLPIFLLAALGLLLTWRKWRQLLFIYLVILLTIGQCLYFYGSSRFRAPIEPMLVILGVGVVWWVMQKFSRGHKTDTESSDQLQESGMAEEKVQPAPS